MLPDPTAAARASVPQRERVPRRPVVSRADTLRDEALAHGFSYGDFHDDSGFEEHGLFDLGDSRIDEGIPFERLVRHRRFDGWDTAYYEPVDRLC